MEGVSTPPDVPTRPGASLSLADFEASKPLFEADSCLEYLLLSLCNNLSLKPKQAAGLLVQNNKYLRRVMRKGIKGDFSLIQFWLQDVYSNTERLCDLMKSEESGDTMGQVLATFQTGLESPDEEVQAWTCRLLSKLSFDFEEKGLMDSVWGWFSSVSGALPSLIAIITSAEGNLLEVSVDVLFHMSQGRLIQVFSLTLRDMINGTGEYLRFVAKVTDILMSSEATREELIDAGVVSYWTEICLREAENILGECRLTALTLLYRLWLLCFSQRSDDDITVQAVLTVFKRGTHDHLEAIRTTCSALLFAALEHLAADRCQQAPVVYKALTLTLVEEHSDSASAQFLLTSFTKLIQRLPSIPLTPLMNILSKKYSLDDSWTVADIELFAEIAKHERLSLQQAVQLIDVCGRIYMTDTVFVRAASVPLALLAKRYLDMEAMQEYLVKFCKIMVVTLVNYSLEVDPLPDLEIQSRRSQRNMHVNLIKWLIQLGSGDFNQKLGEMLYEVNGEYRAVMNVDHGLVKMMMEETTFIPQVTVSQLAPPSPPPEESTPLDPSDPSNYQIVPVTDVEMHHETEPSHSLQIREDTEPTSIIVKYPSSKASKSSAFPHRRVLMDLEKIKKTRMDREEKQKAFQLRVQSEVQQREKLLRQQLEIRKVEQGVTRGISENDIPIYPFNTIKPTSDSEDIQLRDFSPEESRESELLKIVTKKYYRVYKALFQKYSGTGFAVRKESGSSFEWLAERKSKMTEAELVKVLVLFGVVPNLVSKEDVRNLMRSYCAKVAKQHDLTTVDFDGFVGVMSQVAFYAYSETGNRCMLPPSIQLKQLMLHIRDNSLNQGISIDLFDEPDPGAGDRDVVRRLNALLKEDPETPLPSGFRLCVEQDVVVSYIVPAVLGMSEARTVAIEVLDEVVSGKFGVHILEGSVEVIAIHCAKGTKRDDLPPLQDRSAAHFPRTRRLSPDVFPHHTLSPSLKFEVAKLPDDLRAVGQECAQTLETVLMSVALGMQRVINRPMSQNRIRQKKAEKTPEPVVERKEDWKARAREVHERMLRNMQEKLAKRKREEETEQEQKQTLAEELKRAQERTAREKEIRAKALKEWNEKRENERSKQLVEVEAERQLAEKKKKEQQQSLKLLQSKLQNVLKAKQEQWKGVRETMQNQPVKLMEEKALHQQRTVKMLQMEREKAAQKGAKLQEIKSFAEDSEVKRLFQTYNKQMETMFRFFSKKADVKLESDSTIGKLKLPDYAKMAVMIDIVPGLISSDVNALIFKGVTKGKTPEKGQPVTLDETDFREVLVNLADLAREKLNAESADQQSALTPQTLKVLLEHLHLTAPVSELMLHLKRISEENTRSSREKRIASERRSVSTKPAISVMEAPALAEVSSEMERDEEPQVSEEKGRSQTPVPVTTAVQTEYTQPDTKEEQVQFTEEDAELAEINREIAKLEKMQANRQPLADVDDS